MKAARTHPEMWDKLVKVTVQRIMDILKDNEDGVAARMSNDS